jgi:spore cortex formation protein SpoVR/YcgB (stage V sporulation)
MIFLARLIGHDFFSCNYLFKKRNRTRNTAKFYGTKRDCVYTYCSREFRKKIEIMEVPPWLLCQSGGHATRGLGSMTG